MKKYIGFIILLLIVVQLKAQETYKITIPNSYQEPRTDQLNFSGINPSGTTLDVNSRYFIKDEKPWFPVMGEFHYIRYPEQFWEEEIIKMKNGGLSIVATYIFWNAHENPKETWNWEGVRNLRRFAELCQKHEMYVWLRIGPWSHGEQLHGGQFSIVAELFQVDW